MKKILFLLVALAMPFFFTSCETEDATLSSDEFFIAFEQEEIILPKRPVYTELPHQIPLYVAAGRGDAVTVTVGVNDLMVTEQGDILITAEGDTLKTAMEGIDYNFSFDEFPQLNFPNGTGYFEEGFTTLWDQDPKRDTVSIELFLVSNNADYTMGFKYGENADSTSHHKILIHFVDGGDLTINITDENGDDMDDATVNIGPYIEQTGDYFFYNIARGNHPVMISKADYWTFEGNINVNAPDVTEDIAMERAFTATFAVTDESGTAIDDAVISLRSVPPPPAQNFNFEPGEYQFELPARSFTYEVEREGFAVAEGDFTLDGDMTIEVTMEEAE